MQSSPIVPQPSKGASVSTPAGTGKLDSFVETLVPGSVSLVESVTAVVFVSGKRHYFDASQVEPMIPVSGGAVKLSAVLS